MRRPDRGDRYGRRVSGGRSFPFGGGSVLVGEEGAVVAVRHPDGVRPMLLEESGDGVEAGMHDPTRRWGTGFVVTDAGSARFHQPAELTWADDGADLVHRLGPVDLTVSRRFGESWAETYALRTVTDGPLKLGSVGVSTPWRDVYGSAADSLRRAVHAHVWTGGADSWVWAAPMDGSGPGLGLVLTEGELWAYSVESRNALSGSNVRGHLYLHVTDVARAPHAMGGQPEISIEPGAEYRWAWRLSWWDTLPDLHAARSPMIEADELVAEVGQPLTFRAAPGVDLSVPQPLRRSTPGVRHVDATGDGRRSRISVLFHPPLRALVQARVRFALDRQRQPELAGSRRFAFVPYDLVSGLTVRAGGWRDWSDVRERVGTAVLLQEVRRRGWGDRAELDEALSGYLQFVVEHVVAPDGTVADDSRRPGRTRLYNFPWFARFLLEESDLDRAVAVMDRYYALGGERFLAFELGAVLGDLHDRLAACGRGAAAVRLRTHLLGHARGMLAAGEDLPAHEVNYEQSMVAPLLDLLLAARRFAADAVPAAELTRRLRWLQAFAADQPDVRLRHMPIRHWDGYWFGSLRLWGDVFPHYWSVLSAAVFLNWPHDLDPSPGLAAAGRAILRANLAAFAADGAATCAFIHPSCVDGRPAYVADPLANDQDWALVYALRYGWEEAP